MPSISAYAMCFNNPVAFKDLFGLYPVYRDNGESGKGWYDYNGYDFSPVGFIDVDNWLRTGNYHGIYGFAEEQWTKWIKDGTLKRIKPLGGHNDSMDFLNNSEIVGKTSVWEYNFDKPWKKIISFLEDGVTNINKDEIIIYVNRIKESEESTVSKFQAYGLPPLKVLEGYFLEPGGESTTVANKDKRIPSGEYDLDNYSSPKYSDNFVISNELVSKNRSILIHSGNYHNHTLGCFLPGETYSMHNGNYAVWHSKRTMIKLRSLIKNRYKRIVISEINKSKPYTYFNY